MTDVAQGVERMDVAEERRLVRRHGLRPRRRVAPRCRPRRPRISSATEPQALALARSGAEPGLDQVLLAVAERDGALLVRRAGGRTRSPPRGHASSAPGRVQRTSSGTEPVERQDGVGQTGVGDRGRHAGRPRAASGPATITGPPLRGPPRHPRRPSWPMPVRTTARHSGPVDLGRRAEQHVGRRAAGVLGRTVGRARPARRDSARRTVEVPATGRDVDAPGDDGLARRWPRRRADRGQAVEPLGQQPG